MTHLLNTPTHIHNKSITYVVLLIISLFFLVLTGCSPAPQETLNTHQSTYYHSVASQRLQQLNGYKVKRRFSGITQSKQVANLNVEVPGRVKDIYAFEGNTVQKGELLAVLDSELLQIEAEQLTAQLKRIDAEITLSKSSLERVNSLIGDGYSSKQTFDEITAQLQVLQANRLQLLSSINAKQYQINHTHIFAPFAGVINKRLINIGEVVNSNSVAFAIQQQHNNELKVGVPQTLIHQIKKHNEFSLIVNDQQVNVSELAINTEINSLSRTIQLRFSLPAEVDVFNNQIGYFEFEQFFAESGYWVPVSAITDGVRGTWNVFTLEQQENPELYKLMTHSVEVIHIEKDRAFIRASLDDTQPLLQSGLHKVVPNQIVKLIK